jgi:hypothetical protein
MVGQQKKILLSFKAECKDGSRWDKLSLHQIPKLALAILTNLFLQLCIMTLYQIHFAMDTQLKLNFQKFLHYDHLPKAMFADAKSPKNANNNV